jgi:DNA-binding GntR family transcriptional regulator
MKRPLEAVADGTAVPNVLQRESLATQVYEILESRITQGILLPGTRLGEEAIAAEFSISRSPAREATAKLELRGFAERVGVRDRRVAVPTEAFVRDTYETSVVLAVGRSYVASLAAAAEDRIELMTLIGDMEALHRAERHGDVSKLGEHFHALMRKSCNNAHLLAVSSDFEKYRKWLVNIYLIPNPLSPAELTGHYAKSMAEHRAMAEAYVKCDLLGLKQAIETHTIRQRDRVLFLMKNSQA